MSEAALRSSASRGRGSARGGRGGFAGRGGRRTNGDSKLDDASNGAFDDEGDFAELRAQYGDKTAVIREMFPDWSEVDVLFALQETNGDENEAVTRIAEGNISQWGEVSKVKKAPKKKEDTPAIATNNFAPAASRFPGRGGRAVSEGGRGGRGRGVDRGGVRGGRGRPAAPTPAANGARKENQQPLSVPTEESPAWGAPAAKSAQPDVQETPAAAESAKPAAPAAKTWASMLRAQQPKPQPPKPKEPVAAPAPEPVEESIPEPTQAAPESVDPAEESTPVAEPAAPAAVEPEATLEPSKDELTETNLEQVVDVSHPPATATAASTTADSWDPRQNQPSTTATPLSASYQQHQVSDAPGSGHAASALKATQTARVPSFQRRVLDQEEAVRMPGNREVNQAAVQFGAFNLKDGDDDLDVEREEAETRAQPPVESPIAHPRASLPPAAQSSAVPESFSQKQVAPSATPPGPAGLQSQAPSNAQFGRYGQAAPQDAQAPQKPVDPFSQQPTSSQPPFDNFSTPTTQPQSQQPGGAFSSAPGDYSSYYTAGQPERNPYNYYGQHFGGHHGAPGAQDNAQSQQRGFGGYNASQTDNLSQYPQSGMQGRLGSGAADAQNSGHNTPNPTTQAQHQQAGPGSQPQSHGQQYPAYNHPYYNHAYYNQYYSGGYGQAGFGPYGGKGGMYGQPYGMSQNAPFDHASSPGTFNQSSAHRDSGLGASGLGDYGRGSAGQAGSQPGLGGSSFGSMHDSFPRGSSAFQSQSQSFNGQAQAGSNASTDELKPFPDTKTASGPSPSIGGARPGSAANNGPASAQSGLPPPQGSQMGGAYGGYPGHGQQSHGAHGNSGYGMGAGAAGNQHANNPYGSYGQGFGSAGYYGSQQQQQQRGGWGGNYH